jgi:hypothetical protein
MISPVVRSCRCGKKIWKNVSIALTRVRAAATSIAAAIATAGEERLAKRTEIDWWIGCGSWHLLMP